MCMGLFSLQEYKERLSKLLVDMHIAGLGYKMSWMLAWANRANWKRQIHFGKSHSKEGFFVAFHFAAVVF